MAVKGVFTSDAGIVGERSGDFQSALMQIDPTGMAALFALTSGMEQSAAKDTAVHWFEENKISGRISATNAAGTGTTVIVDDASYTIVGTTFLVEASGELMLVTGVSGLTLTVTRGFAGTTVVTFDGSSTPVPIQKLGNNFEEASARPVAVANQGYPRFNHCEIFRDAWDISGSAAAIDFITGSKVAKNRREASLLHGESIEKKLWFGKKTLSTLNGKPFRTMDGILTQITTNSSVQSTNVSYTNIRDFLQGVFEKNIKGKPNERIAFCGNTVLAVLDTIVMTHASMQIFPGQTDFGMNVNLWRTPFGNITLMTHPLFNESPLWTKNLYVLHPGALRMRWLRRTMHDQYDKDGTRAGIDADFGVFTSELTCQYMAEKTGGKFTGIDTANVAAL